MIANCPCIVDFLVHNFDITIFLNSIFKYKLENTFEYKLGGFDTWELVPDITDYELEFMTQKFKFGSNSAYRGFRGRKISVW